jgi:hypothetical protein
MCEPRHTHARTFALRLRYRADRFLPMHLKKVSHANARRRIPRPWLAMGFRCHEGLGLLDGGPVARTRVDKCAGVRPRFIRISSPHLNQLPR